MLCPVHACRFVRIGHRDLVVRVSVPENPEILTLFDSNVGGETRPGVLNCGGETGTKEWLSARHRWESLSAVGQQLSVSILMANHHSLHHEHHILSDVGCQIRDALQVT